MPVEPTYPGAHIEEIPSGVRTITGVATSVAAFVDRFARGPLGKPVRLVGVADLERELGGLSPTSEASYAIQQFFINGGSECWAVRVADTTSSTAPATAASATLRAQPGAGATTIALNLACLTHQQSEARKTSRTLFWPYAGAASLPFLPPDAASTRKIGLATVAAYADAPDVLLHVEPSGYAPQVHLDMLLGDLFARYETIVCDTGSAPGDANKDCTVDVKDIQLLLDHWGEDGPVADCNGDGVVDGADLGMILADWSR